jgi:hypothetical protein
MRFVRRTPDDTAEQLNLGQLIALLTEEPPDNLIMYDFGNLVPTYVGSYRGYYNELALGWAEDNGVVRVSEVLQVLSRAVGATFPGYKGGQYGMGTDTPVWIANYGKATSTAPIGVTRDYHVTLIHTGYIE